MERLKEEAKRLASLDEARKKVFPNTLYGSINACRANLPFIERPKLTDYRRMAQMSVADAEHLIQTNLFVQPGVEARLTVLSSKTDLETFTKSEKFLNFVDSVRKHGIGCLDTENKPATILLLSDITGLSFAINNLSKVGIPDQIKQLLGSRTIKWLQSDIEEDVEQLIPYVTVSNWVNSIYLYRSCVEDEPGNKNGRGVQAVFLGQTHYPYYKKEGKKFVYRCDFNRKNWGSRERLHALQDACVPVALALRIAITYMREYGFDDGAEILPFLHSMLNSFVKLRHPKPIVSRFSDADRPWRPAPVVQDEKCVIDGPSIVHDLRRINEERYALDLYTTDLTTPRYQEPPPLVNNSRADQARENWRGHELPWDDGEMRFGRFCRYCAGPRHNKCPLHKKARCLYPLCRNPESPHVVKCCWSLHRFCEFCGLRGHPVEAHQRFCLEMLRRFFIKWSPFGLYTSLVYMEPQNPQYWMYFLYGTRMIDHRTALEAQIAEGSQQDEELAAPTEEDLQMVADEEDILILAPSEQDLQVAADEVPEETIPSYQISFPITNSQQILDLVRRVATETAEKTTRAILAAERAERGRSRSPPANRRGQSSRAGIKRRRT